jgi:hypothetical protein
MRLYLTRFGARLLGLALVWLLPAGSIGAEDTYALPVVPAEHKSLTDPQTGAELLFLTTDPGEDTNLYYEQRSWLADSSLILFNSAREDGGLMGYLTETGELVRLMTPKGGLGGPTAARDRNSVFAVRGAEIVELALDIRLSSTPQTQPSQVMATERVICELGSNHMPTNTSLTESADGKHLAVGAGTRGGEDGSTYGYALVIDVSSGAVRELRRVPGPDFAGHVMFSLTNPNLFSFCVGPDSYLEVVDIRDGGSVWRHLRRDGEEFCTHHCWWANDTITFCGGFHLKPNEDFDVKVVDIYTREVRIIGRGNWWPGATPAELAARNWWHASGHESGRWVAADNWHGDIGIFHGKTTRTYWLTKGHRTYGGGRHPEVGWDRRAERVVFASHLLGNVDVCVATIPEAWQREWDKQF